MTAIVLDTETTGLDKEQDRVVEICVLDWTDGSTLMLQRLNPGRPIPPEVTAIHGISDSDVVNCPNFSAVANELKSRIESAEAVIGYHVFFDQDMINSEFSRLDLSVRWPTLVCAKRLWDVYEPREERHLSNAYRRFVDRAGFENAHSALADTRAVRDVLINQIAVFGLGKVAWSDFDPTRKLWWGPSSHLLMRDDGSLIVNFGKNKDRSVWDVDVGFWRWVTTRDFPGHVLLLALEMVSLERLDQQSRREAVLSWAITMSASFK